MIFQQLQSYRNAIDINYSIYKNACCFIRIINLTWVIALLTFIGIVNTLRPRQNGRHFADDTFRGIFLKENVKISIKISLKFVPESPIDNIPALVPIMAWRRTGDKPLSEPMMTQFNDAYMRHSASMS